MMNLSTDPVAPGGVKDIVVHFIPAVVSICLFQLIAIEIYHNNSLGTSRVHFFIWLAAQACGSYVLGAASDQFCRRKTLIVTQVCGIFGILLLLWSGCDYCPAILLTGLTFGPSAVAKAALVDNFPKTSKVRIIGITFIATFIPWCFFTYIISYDPVYILIPAVLVLLLNLFVTIFYFEDRRDKSTNHMHGKKFFNLHHKARAFLTALALLPAEIVFFLSDAHFEESITNGPFFSLLGIGSLIGAIVSVFYRKTPHLSMISICYGMGFIFCSYALIATKWIVLDTLDIRFIIVMFSVLGGFYLPFIYDAILSSVSSNYRGTACGIIEIIISFAALTGLSIILLFEPHEWMILLLMTFLFLVAFIVQRYGEKHDRFI